MGEDFPNRSHQTKSKYPLWFQVLQVLQVRQVFQALLENNRLRRKDLISMFNESQYVIDRALDFLKKSDLIVYQNHGKHSWWDVYANNAEKCFAKTEK